MMCRRGRGNLNCILRAIAGADSYLSTVQGEIGRIDGDGKRRSICAGSGELGMDSELRLSNLRGDGTTEKHGMHRMYTRVLAAEVYMTIYQKRHWYPLFPIVEARMIFWGHVFPNNPEGARARHGGIRFK